MELFIGMLALAVLSFWLGMKVTTYLQHAMFRRILAELNITDAQLVALADKQKNIIDKVVEVKVECHNDILYAYRLEDDKFLGQASTAEELVNRLRETMEAARIIISEENGANLLRPKA